MTSALLAARGWTFVVGLALLPVLAGRMYVSDSLLLVGWAAVLLLLTGVARALERTAGSSRRLDFGDRALLAFALLQIASLAVSVYLFASLVYAARVVAGITLFWLARYGLRDRQWQRRALWGLVAGGALVSIWGIREYVRTVFFLDQPEWRIFSTFYNPNCLAGYLLLTVFPAVALLFGTQTRAGAAAPSPAPRPVEKTGSRQDRKAKRRQARREPTADSAQESAPPRYPEIAAAFAVLLMLVALLLTGSKAAFGAAMVAGTLFGILAARLTPRPRLVRGLALAGAGLMLAVALTLPPIRVRLVNAFGWQNHSMRFRWYTWQGTAAMIKAKPWLGHGGGTFEWSFPRYAVAGYTRQAHQSFLQLAAECGVPALGAGLVWGTFVLMRLGRGLAGTRTGLLPGLVGVAGIAALLASSMHALVDYAWYVPAVEAAFFALAGLALGMVSERPPQPEAPTAQAPSRRQAHAWLAVTSGALLLAWTLATGRGEALGNRGDRLVGQGAYAAAAETYARAAAWSPLQARFQVQRSKVFEALAQAGAGDMLARAIETRRAATRLQPTEAVNYVALARLYAEAKDMASAVAAAQEGLRWYPRYPRGMAQLGEMQKRAGRDAEALATYERLAALYDTPVGQCPAITEMVETAYCYAWIALGDQARSEGRRAEADLYFAKATAVVSWALATESAVARQLVHAGLGSYGHVEENREIAKQLAERFGGRSDAHAVFRRAQLARACGDAETTGRLLSRLAAWPAPEKAGEEPRLRTWAVLTRAIDLSAERQEEEAKDYAAKGLQMARELPAQRPSGRTWWLAEDEAALNNLRHWAESYLSP